MAKAAKPKAATKSKAKAAAKAKMAAKSDARVFSVDTRFQKMARREGGIARDKAIEQAQTEIKELKSHFDGWLAGELKEFVRLMKKVEGAKAGKDWIRTANFHSHQLRDSATTLGFELLAFIAGSLCEILEFDRSRRRMQHGIDHLPHRIPASCRAGVLSSLEAGAGPGFDRRLESGRQAGHGAAVHLECKLFRLKIDRRSDFGGA